MTWYMFYQAFRGGTKDKVTSAVRRGASAQQSRPAAARSVSTQASAAGPKKLAAEEMDFLVIDVSAPPFLLFDSKGLG